MLNTRILEIYEDRIIKIFPEFHDQTLNCPTAVMAHIPRIKVANMSLVQSRAHKDIGSLITFEYIFVYYPSKAILVASMRLFSSTTPNDFD